MSVGGRHSQEGESVSEKVPDHVPQVPLCLRGLLEEPGCLVKLKGSGRSHKREPTPAVCTHLSLPPCHSLSQTFRGPGNTVLYPSSFGGSLPGGRDRFLCWLGPCRTLDQGTGSGPRVPEQLRAWSKLSGIGMGRSWIVCGVT